MASKEKTLIIRIQSVSFKAVSTRRRSVVLRVTKYGRRSARRMSSSSRSSVKGLTVSPGRSRLFENEVDVEG